MADIPEGFELVDAGIPEGFEVVGPESAPSQEQAPQQPFQIESVTEPVQAISSGIGSSIVGGLAGIGQSLFDKGMAIATGQTFSPEQSAEVVEDIQKNAFQPQTEGGKAAMIKIGELAKQGVDFTNVSIGKMVALGQMITDKDISEGKVVAEVKKKGISAFLGDATLEATGSPEAAALAFTAPTAIGEAFGLKGAGTGARAGGRLNAAENFQRSVRSSEPLINPETGVVQPEFQKALAKYDIDAGALVEDSGNLPVIYSGDKPAQVVDAIVKKQIRLSKPANYLAKLRLGEKGNIVRDELGALASKHGFDLGDIAAAKSGNLFTRKASQKMLRMQRAIMADKTNVDKFRPSDVVGDSVMGRVKYVRDEANKLSKQLDNMASKELTISGRNLLGDGNRLKGMSIDPTRIEKSVVTGLEGLNVQGLDEIMSGARGVNLSDAVFKKGFFDGSDIMTDKTSQRIIKDVFTLLKHNPDGPIDALRAHNVKKQIDSLIDFNKKSSQGLTESGRRFAKSIRHEMNESVRDVSPKYAEVNDKLSRSIGAINDLEDAVGRRVDLFDANAHQAVGTDMRKLLSNYGTRQVLNNSLNGIDDTAKALGGTFDTNFRALNRFSNVLDSRFGSVATNSFTGSINSALDLNRLRSTSVKEAVIEKGLGAIADRFGPNDQKAFDVMQKLLVRGK